MFNNWLNKLCSLAVLALVLVGIGTPPAHATGTVLVPVNDKLKQLGPKTGWQLGIIGSGPGPFCPSTEALFAFITGFQNTSTSTLTNLQAQVTTLTGSGTAVGIGDYKLGVLIEAVPVGGILPLSLVDPPPVFAFPPPYGDNQYADGILSSNESTYQLFYACLNTQNRFRLFVDILGTIAE